VREEANSKMIRMARIFLELMDSFNPQQKISQVLEIYGQFSKQTERLKLQSETPWKFCASPTCAESSRDPIRKAGIVAKERPTHAIEKKQ
jgi:hypothetical protein